VGHGLGTLIGTQLLAIGFAQWACTGSTPTETRARSGSHGGPGLRKIGMTYEGTLRQTMLSRDGWRELRGFSIVGSKKD